MQQRSIIISTQCLSPVRGGIEILMSGLAGALREHGDDVRVFADGYGDEAERDHDGSLPYRLVRVGGWKWLRRRQKIRLLRDAMRDSRPDGIFTDSWKSAELLVPHTESLGIRLVCLAHGNDVLAAGDGRRRRRIVNTLRRTHRVIANSADTAARTVALGLERERLAVVCPGVIPPASDARPPPCLALDEAPVLLTLGRVELRKGHDQVLRCLPELLGEFPRLIYLVAGTGPDLEKLRRLASELGVSDRVRFLGRVSESLKAGLLHAADVMVMPGRLDTTRDSVEGFGISYIEAAFCDLAVVAGSAGGESSAVLHERTGLLCDGEDLGSVLESLRRCLRDPAERQRLGRAAGARARQEFSWPGVVEKYLECLQ